ncbi:MAG: translation initiation factor Sui1 [Desulfobacterales bacterium]|nr:translation initiation factor Sui1 [Desulfobacterales bacterium]
MKKPKSNALVYSTDGGRSCPGCGHPLKQCCCSRQKIPQRGDGVVRISRQTKGRKGSGVCVITGLPLGEPDLKRLAKQLKKKCGSGGTVKGGVIEIQGNHRETLVEALQKIGYTVKLAGG